MRALTDGSHAWSLQHKDLVSTEAQYANAKLTNEIISRSHVTMYNVPVHCISTDTNVSKRRNGVSRVFYALKSVLALMWWASCLIGPFLHASNELILYELS